MSPTLSVIAACIKLIKNRTPRIAAGFASIKQPLERFRKTPHLPNLRIQFTNTFLEKFLDIRTGFVRQVFPVEKDLDIGELQTAALSVFDETETLKSVLVILAIA